jgi:hypothetical protein
MSPEVQAYGQLPSTEQAAEMFKQRFSEMAYNVMMAKFPELAAQVVTFKLIETDAESGKGVGAFVLLLEDKTIYIPVVMVDSQLKPFDMFYFKDLNIFLPLSNEWLDEVSKSALSNLGEPAKLPQGVSRDMSIRDIIVPPIMPEGRIGLASDMSEMFKAASYNPKPRFLEFVKNASHVVLDGLRLTFERNPSFGQKIAQYYGKKALTEAFQTGYARTVKTAAENKKPVVRVFNLETYQNALPELKRECGLKIASDLFGEIAMNGVGTIDTRPVVKNKVVKVESPVCLSPATETGFYNLYFPDKTKKLCLVAATVPDGDYLVMFADGSKAWTVYKNDAKTLIGEPELDDSVIKATAIYKALEGGSNNKPTMNKHNVALYVSKQGKLQACGPKYISRVTDNGDGTTTLDSGHIDSDNIRGRIMTSSGSMSGSTTFYPKSTSWFSVPDPWENKLKPIDDPNMITRWIDQHLADKTDEAPINVKKAVLAQWWVEGIPTAVYLEAALEKVATRYDLSLNDASRVLDDATKNGTCRLRLIKRAQGEEMMQQEAAPPQDPALQQQGMDPAMMQQQGMDPSMMGMDPSMMGMMPPQPPQLSPTDLAIAETVQGLQQENQLRMQQIQDQMAQQQQAMQMQMESNEKLIGVLTQIQQRASAIGQATGGIVPPEAMQSPLAAGQMLAPIPPPQPEPPPMPVMQEEGPASAEMVASQIHPELAEQAADFQDAGMFDTSVLAVMAAAPLLRDIVSTYIPNLEKALDNIGRIQLTLWMREAETKSAIGNDAFVLLEDKLRNVFKNLGEIVLQVNRNALDTEAGAMQSQRMLGDQQ